MVDVLGVGKKKVRLMRTSPQVTCFGVFPAPSKPRAEWALPDVPQPQIIERKTLDNGHDNESVIEADNVGPVNLPRCQKLKSLWKKAYKVENASLGSRFEIA